MEPNDGPEPPIFQEFRSLMPDLALTKFSRFEFYEEASGPDTCLQIVTGEQRIYATCSSRLAWSCRSTRRIGKFLDNAYLVCYSRLMS